MSILNKLIFLIFFAVLISGCISSDSPTPEKVSGFIQTPTENRPIPIQTPVLTQTPIVNQRSSMSFTEFNEAITSNDLTSLQKENLYLNKIFTWDGQVKDVSHDAVIIEISKYINYHTEDVINYYKKNCEYYNADVKIRQSCLRTNIRLHISDDQKSQLDSLSKGSIITFEGTITNKNINFISEINMYNGKIIDYILTVIN